MFPPATPGSTLNEHPDAGIAYIRVSSCLYKQFIHLSLYLPEVSPRCYAGDFLSLSYQTKSW